MVTPWPRLTQKTCIPPERLLQLNRGVDPTDAKINALAAVWLMPPDALRASIAESRAVTRRVHSRLRDDGRGAA